MDLGWRVVLDESTGCILEVAAPEQRDLLGERGSKCVDNPKRQSHCHRVRVRSQGLLHLHRTLHCHQDRLPRLGNRLDPHPMRHRHIDPESNVSLQVLGDTIRSFQ